MVRGFTRSGCYSYGEGVSSVVHLSAQFSIDCLQVLHSTSHPPRAASDGVLLKPHNCLDPIWTRHAPCSIDYEIDGEI